MKLGEIGEIITGTTPSKKDSRFYNERNINFFKPDDFDQNGIALLAESKDFISKEGVLYARVAPSETVLTTCIGIIGKVGMLKQRSSFNQQINAIIAEKTAVIPKYLAYAIYNRRNFLERLANAPIVPIINKSQFAQFQIPLPPLPTQHKIVEILEEADNLRKFRRQADEKMKDLIPSFFVQMFGDPATNPKGWKVKKLEDVCIKITDGSHRTPKLLDKGYPFLTVSNLQNGSFEFSNSKYISIEDYKDLVKNDCKPLQGDVLFSKDGTIGKVTEIKEEKEIVILSSLAIMRPQYKIINSTYLAEIALTDFFINQAKEKQSGSALRRIILKNLKSVKIPVPPLSLQQEFAKLIEEIEAEKARQAESKKKLDDLFASLMQRAFTGKLVA